MGVIGLLEKTVRPSSAMSAQLPRSRRGAAFDPVERLVGFLALIITVLFGSTGCGRSELPTGAVSGRVTYGGEPVTEGTVLFQPEKGPAAVGGLDGNGRYVLRTRSLGGGAVVGSHVVTIVPPTDIDIIGIRGPGELPKREFPNIPISFHHASTTTLAAEVKPGVNVFDFELRQ